MILSEWDILNSFEGNSTWVLNSMAHALRY